ncbi:pentatricopeptide repeat-containing protein At1g30610, chloroplastic-like [Vicia villosa]|uniref:pentatricopeptide repeat-containing protein At1g30610, chloroplastic-like n=1 Tax=Vicia villosa TaxID=3911 RepID=UPI00273B7C8C|nr:pentatricopeptide repeat-containing protein At1g30610, chloroplastic-like [Vicia villosa]
MVVIAFEFNANFTASSSFHYAANSFSSRPFFVSNAPNFNFTPLTVSMKYASNSDHLLPKELEFKPSFDEYLKAMESAKSVRVSDTVKKGQEGNHVRNLKRVGTKIYKKDDEGSSTGNGNARGKPNKGFRDVYGGKERNQHRSSGLAPKSDDCSVIKSQREIRTVGIGDNIIRSNLNGVHGGSVVERGAALVTRRERDHSRKGKTLGGDNFIDREKTMDTSPGKRYSEIQSFTNRNGRSNGNIKRFQNRGYDSDNLEVDRAAFKNLEDPNNVITKAHFSHKEMEDRIQKLAKQLNGVDINLPEWMFSKMIRSAKLKFNDYSIRRLITILGNLGNWQRVIQVIEWLQMRERFQSHKPRHVYNAALDALGKLRRPVEALNVFHAMQQQLSTYPDLVAYHSIAVTLGQAGHMKQLFDVIDIMRSPPKKKFNKGIFENWDPRLEPDIIVYNAVLNACVKGKQWEGAFWVLQQLKKQNIQPSAATYGLVMEVMFSCGKYNLVHDFFRKLQKSSIPNPLTYRVLVNTFWKEGKTDEAVSSVNEMERRGIVGSASLYYDLARCLCAAGRSQEALMQIDKICKVASKPLVVTYTGLMQASLDSGNIQDGAYIFEKMKENCAPNLVTYNIMLKAYVEHGMFQEAKELFERMLENTNYLSNKDDYKMRVVPDIYTFNTMLDACAADKKWDYFDHVYQRMLYHGYHFNPKRHLRMILEASRAGKEEPLEITWKHLAATDRIPPVSLIKERFCTKLEKDDYVVALKCITNNTPKDLQPFSKLSWLNLFKENSQRFHKDTLVRLMNAASNVISNNSVPNPALVCLVQSCKELCFDSHHNVAYMDSASNVFALENKRVVTNTR